MRLSDEGRAILKRYETGGRMQGNRLIVLKSGEPALETYIDDAGRPTIGWGHTGTLDGVPLALGMRITRQKAEALFDADIDKFERGVMRLIQGGAETNQNQFDALVLFAYNVGLGNPRIRGRGLGGSTLLKKHRAGDYEGAAAQFALWNKAGGRVMRGLTRRRAEEASLYMRPVEVPVKERTYIADVSKRVEPDPPKPLTSSKGIVGAVTGSVVAAPITVEGLMTATSSMRDLQGEADKLQHLAWLSTALGFIIFALSAYIIWKRFNNRSNGLD